MLRMSRLVLVNQLSVVLEIRGLYVCNRGAERVGVRRGDRICGQTGPKARAEWISPSDPLANRGGFHLARLMSSSHSALAMSSSASSEDIYSSSDTILEVLGKNPKWSTFRALLSAMPEFTETMDNKDLILDTIYTVFVPTNTAFAKLEKEILFKIGKKDNLPILRKLVRHHFVDDVMTVEDISQIEKIPTLALLEINVRPAKGAGLGGLLGDNSRADAAAGGIRLNEGIITTADIQCCNGVIHEVDNLLNPYLYYRYLV